MRFDFVRLNICLLTKTHPESARCNVINASGSLQGLPEFLECCGLGVNHLRHG